MAPPPVFPRRALLRGALGLGPLALGLGAAGCALARTSAAYIRPGIGEFEFTAWEGPSIKVFYTAPEGLSGDTPVAIVMHGMQRDADAYRDQWISPARDNGLLVLVPRFDKAGFPREEDYTLGGVLGPDGKPRPPRLWAFTAVEALFEQVRRDLGLTARRYGFYGHSAGAQFVHRMLFMAPKARFDRVVMANAGWYTLPDFTVAWPYGLKGAPASRSSVAAALSHPAYVLLGEKDIDPHHKALRRTPEAMAQGPFRFARGHYFFRAARAQAKALGAPFAWSLAYVPGADHSNTLMAPEGARLLAGHAPSKPADVDAYEQPSA